MAQKLTRGQFLKTMATSAAALSLGACTPQCKKGEQCEKCEGTAECADMPKFKKKLPVGIQLYSVRTDLEKDFYGTLKAIHEMGYHGVEFYGEFYGNSMVDVKKMCTELHLTPFSSHVPFQAMIDDVNKVISDYTALGTQYVVFPYMDEASRPGVDFEQFCATTQKLGEIGAEVYKAGFQLLYHNHDFEFVDTKAGMLGYDYLFEKNAPQNLQNEIDTCWVDYSGQCPMEYLKKYAGRTPVVHLKDYKLEGKLKTAPYALIGISTDNSMKDDGGSFEYRPLGMGQTDMPHIIEAAIDCGAQWLCVEQDEPCEGLSRLEGVAKSTDYLRSLDLL